MSESVIICILRIGGWQVVLGAKSVLRIYAQKVLEDDVYCSALSQGHVQSPSEHKHRLEQYLGQDSIPDTIIKDQNAGSEPMQIKSRGWRSPEYRELQAKINFAGDALIILGKTSEKRFCLSKSIVSSVEC